MVAEIDADDVEAGEEKWLFRLYVAGQSPRSLRAFSNLHEFCAEHLAGHYEIETVDLVEHPDRASEDDILAIPTLVRRFPAPSHRIIGDLSNSGQVMSGLRLRPLTTQ